MNWRVKNAEIKLWMWTKRERERMKTTIDGDKLKKSDEETLGSSTQPEHANRIQLREFMKLCNYRSTATRVNARFLFGCSIARLSWARFKKRLICIINCEKSQINTLIKCWSKNSFALIFLSFSVLLQTKRFIIITTCRAVMWCKIQDNCANIQ